MSIPSSGSASASDLITNKRAINADALLLPVFGKPQVTMFELAKIVGPHLS